jgi:hypothetical protein
MIKKNKYPIFSTKTCFSLFMTSHPVPIPFLSYLLSPSFFFLLARAQWDRESESRRLRERHKGQRERERVESRELRGRLRDRERESQRSGGREPNPEPKELRRLNFRPMLLVGRLQWCLGRGNQRTQELGPATHEPNPTNPGEPMWPDPSGGPILHVRRSQ